MLKNPWYAMLRFLQVKKSEETAILPQKPPHSQSSYLAKEILHFARWEQSSKMGAFSWTRYT